MTAASCQLLPSSSSCQLQRFTGFIFCRLLLELCLFSLLFSSLLFSFSSPFFTCCFRLSDFRSLDHHQTSLSLTFTSPHSFSLLARTLITFSSCLCFLLSRIILFILPCPLPSRRRDTTRSNNSPLPPPSFVAAIEFVVSFPFSSFRGSSWQRNAAR